MAYRPSLFAVYRDVLITELRRLGLGCRLYDEFYACLLYADDIVLLSHFVNSMQRMLHVCDLFASEFDVKFNSTKSVAIRCGPRYDVVCASLQLAGQDSKFVTEVKYLGVHIVASKCFKCSIDHVKLKFYRVFNCVYAGVLRQEGVPRRQCHRRSGLANLPSVGAVP